jgi:hypothetical protein
MILEGGVVKKDEREERREKGESCLDLKYGKQKKYGLAGFHSKRPFPGLCSKRRRHNDFSISSGAVTVH